MDTLLSLLVFLGLLLNQTHLEGHFETPWGKDEFLFETPNTSASAHSLQKMSTALYHFHRDVLSKADGPRSHYAPSSSYYMEQAIREYGFFRGFCKGCDRLMRENEDPWIYPYTFRGPYRIKYDFLLK